MFVWTAGGAVSRDDPPRRTPQTPKPIPIAATTPAAASIGTRGDRRPAAGAAVAAPACEIPDPDPVPDPDEPAEADSASYSSTISRSSIATSFIDWNLWSGLLARQ